MRPPREGARWGEEPGPSNIRRNEASLPPALAALCVQYGEANVLRAISVYEKTSASFPHLSILRHDELEFVEGVLQSSVKSMQIAAADGRVHSLPETLELLEKSMGEMWSQAPNTSLNFWITYGDEHKGRAEKEAKRKKDEETRTKKIAIIALVSMFIFIASTMMTGSAVFGLLAAGMSIGIMIGILFSSS